jgi:hypothetical protein
MGGTGRVLRLGRRGSEGCCLSVSPLPSLGFRQENTNSLLQMILITLCCYYLLRIAICKRQITEKQNKKDNPTKMKFSIGQN